MSDSQRIDRFLWFARLTKSRRAAQALCEQGHIRHDGRRVDRAHAAVRVGNVLSVPRAEGVLVIRIESLPKRRGPPAEARSLYTELGGERPLTAAEHGHSRAATGESFSA